MADGANMPHGGALMPRASVFEIEAHRNRAVELYGQAWDALDEAIKATAAAAPSGRWDAPRLAKNYQGHTFNGRDDFVAQMVKQTDRAVWSHLILSTNLDKLMDRTERDAFRQQCDADPPPATAENLLATMERLLGDAGLIFKRGIALAFSALDRRFRSGRSLEWYLWQAVTLAALLLLVAALMGLKR